MDIPSTWFTIILPAAVFGGLAPGWLALPVVALGWVWVVNLFNFMDGIDGVAGAQAAGAGAAFAGDQGLAYRIVSEPANQLAKAHRVAITPKAETPLAEVPGEYVEGMAQPAVVAFDGAGRELFHWAIDPSTMNLGGASDRPLPADIWPVLGAALAGETKALEGTTKLDPGYLAAHYPEQHAAFQAWVAASQG